MTHLDLFSGIGGFAFAARKVWKEEYKNIGFVEIDKYCQALLKLRFPESKVYDDIRQFKYQPEMRCDIITGGFPCQPFSSIGKRRSREDSRNLWPEMLRVISEFQPRWVVAENVCGLLTIENEMVFEQVYTDLEKQGYKVQPFIIPAIAVNAPHRRNRLWIVANSDTLRLQGERAKQQTDRVRQLDEDITNTEIGKSREQTESEGREGFSGRNKEDSAVTNTKSFRPYSKKDKQEMEEQGDDKLCSKQSRDISWDREWIEVAAKLCGIHDGFPAELDGFKLSKSRHRIERLKALGNAIVPQVVMQIFTAIKESESKSNESNIQTKKE